MRYHRGRPVRSCKVRQRAGSRRQGAATSGAASRPGAEGRPRPRSIGPQGGQPGGMRAGQQLVQGRVDARRTISARPSAVKPRKRGCSGSAARRGQRRAPARRGACGAGRPRSTRMAPDRLRRRIWRRERRQRGAVGRPLRAGLGRRAAVADAMSTSIATRAGVGWMLARSRRAGRPRLGQRPDRAERVVEGAAHQAAPGWRRQAGSSTHPGRDEGREPRTRRAALEQPGGPGRAAPARQPRALAALRRAHDADGDRVALARPAAARAVGQEAVRAPAGDEGARHRRHMRGHPAAMQVADAVGRAGPPDRVVQQARRPARRDRGPRRAGRRRRMRAHGHAGSRGRAAAAPSRTAAGRRRRSSCRSAAARSRRRGPGWRSRRPCRRPRRRRRRRRSARAVRRAKTTALSHHALGAAAVRRQQHHGGQHVVPPAGQQGEAGADLVRVLRLGQDAAADGDDGVGGQDEAPRLGGGGGLLARQAAGVGARRSSRRGVSSMSAGTTRSGTTPIWARSARRRGLAEARTSGGRPDGAAT